MNIDVLTEKFESISVMYADSFDIERDSNWFMIKLSEEMGELMQAYLKVQNQARVGETTPSERFAQFEDEAADVLGQLLLLANHFNMDLETAVQRKWLKWLPNQ